MLDTLPPDILDHIAFFAASHAHVGPPSGLIPLLLVSRALNAALTRTANPHLYARIFEYKFDAEPLARRYRQLRKSERKDDAVLAAHVLAEELVVRCRVLTRFRTSYLARADDGTQADRESTENGLDEMLLVAFVLTMENEGRNIAQLRQYARITDWLAVFWFDPAGASSAVKNLDRENWPLMPVYSLDERIRSREAFAMWLLWFYLDPRSYIGNAGLYKKAEQILKLVSLNGASYPLSRFPWTSFNPSPNQIHFGAPGRGPTQPVGNTSFVPVLLPERGNPYFRYASLNVDVTPLPPAIPAVLCLLSLQARARRHMNQHGGLLNVEDLINMTVAEAFVAHPFEITSTIIGIDGSKVRQRVSPSVQKVKKDIYSSRWDSDWMKFVHAVDKDGKAIANSSLASAQKTVYKTFTPGSFDGSWEGIFTYTEFSTFSQLLSGLPPSTLMDCLLAQHHQTWRVKEYHCLAPASSSQMNNDESSEIETVPACDPLYAHLPDDASFSEIDHELHIRLSSVHGGHTLVYKRWQTPEEEKRGIYAARVLDIVLVGEGHSGWGEFRLWGRVRPADGFVSIVKEYNGGERGRWLYRGYLVGEGEGIDRPGGGEGYFAGRWRETMTPFETHGYEGAFAMGRRR